MMQQNDLELRKFSPDGEVAISGKHQIIDTSDPTSIKFYEAAREVTEIAFPETLDVSTLNDRSFVVYSAEDAVAYTVWFNYNGTGTLSPANGIEVAVAVGDSPVTVATTLQANVDALDDLVAVKTGRYTVKVAPSEYGITSATAEVDSGLSFTRHPSYKTLSKIIKIDGEIVSVIYPRSI